MTIAARQRDDDLRHGNGTDSATLKDRELTNEKPVPAPKDETAKVVELGSEMRQLKWISTAGFTVLGTILAIMYATMREDDKSVESRATAAIEKLDTSLVALTGRVGNLEVGQARIEEQLKFVNLNIKSGFETLSKDLERLYKDKTETNKPN